MTEQLAFAYHPLPPQSRDRRRISDLPAEELREMIQSYYRARGWDKSGFIPEDKLRELGFTEVSISQLKAY